MDMDKQPPIPEQQGLQEGRPYTVDSGAAESVGNPEDFPDAVIEPSPASLAGKGYLGAGKERIMNEGQMRIKRMLEPGFLSAFLFQAAKGWHARA